MPPIGGIPGKSAPTPRRVVIQAPTAPPIILPTRKSNTAPPASSYHPAPARVGTRRYSPTGQPSSGFKPVRASAVSVPAATHAQARQQVQARAAAVADRQALNAISALLHENHRLAEHIQTKGGGLSIGAIAPYLIPGAGEMRALTHIPGIAGNLASDVYHLPATTLQGVEQTGSALVHDVAHGELGALGGARLHGPGDNGSQLAKLLGNTVTGDPFYQGIVKGNWKALEKHPLQGVLDVTGVGGALGRTLGAAARTGALGERLAGRTGALERVTVAPGYSAQVERRMSNNLLTAGLHRRLLQRLEHGGTGRLTTAARASVLKRSEAVARQGHRAEVPATQRELRNATQLQLPRRGPGGGSRTVPIVSGPVARRLRPAEAAARQAVADVMPHAVVWGDHPGGLRTGLSEAMQHFAKIRLNAVADGNTALAAAAAKHEAALERVITTSGLNLKPLLNAQRAYAEHPGIVQQLQNDFRHPSATYTTPFDETGFHDIRVAAGGSPVVKTVGPETSGLPAPGMEHLGKVTGSVLREAGLHNEYLKLIDRTGTRGFSSAKAAADEARIAEHRSGIKGSLAYDGVTHRWHALPEPAVKEFMAQVKRDDPNIALRGYFAWSRKYARSVLAFSPKLPIMHTVESVSRTLLNSGLRGLGDIGKGRGLIKSDVLTPEERAYAENTLVPGATGGHGTVETAFAKPGVEARAVGVPASIRRVGAGMSQMFDKVTGTIIQGQRALVKSSEFGSLGKEARAMARDLGQSWIQGNKLSKQVADQLAQGLRDPVTIERLARQMHKSMGQYGAFTVRAGHLLRYFPFMPWYLNAAKLVYYGLPVNHPLITMINQDIANGNRAQWEAQHKGLPGDMQSYLPLGGNQFMDVPKFTPVGVDKNPLITAGSLFGGPLAAPAQALMGIGAFGERFQHGYLSKADYKRLLKHFQAKGLSYTQANDAIKQYMKGSAFSGQPGDLPHGLLSAAEAAASETLGPTAKIAGAVYGKGGALSNVSTPTLRALAALATLGQDTHAGIIEPRSKDAAAEMSKGNFGAGLAHSFDPLRPVSWSPKPAAKRKSRGGSIWNVPSFG